MALNKKNKSTISFQLMFFLLMLAVFIVLTGLRYKKNQDRKKVEAEKQQLQTEILSLEKENQELEKTLAYLNTDDYKEKFARTQLNLKKDGETVFNFIEGSVNNVSDNSDSTQKNSNFSKWRKYFFP